MPNTQESQKPEDTFTLNKWVDTRADTYNLSEQYKAEVMPLVQALEAKCRELNMPFMFRAVQAQDERSNESVIVNYLGGPERATPELIMYIMLNQFNSTAPEAVLELMQACRAKYSPKVAN